MLKTLPPSCAVVMKSGNLNFVQPSGPLQACNGTDLPLFIRSQFMWKFGYETSSGLGCKFSLSDI